MIFLFLLASTISFASAPPCTKWEFLVKANNSKEDQITASDWKTYEHPAKQHPLRTEISEYSVSKGVSFLYDKLDPKQEVRILYWGADPKKINF